MISLSVLKSLFLLFLVMAGGFIGDIFGCASKRILSLNIYAKHIVFICLIYFTIDFSSEDNMHPINILKLTVELWIFYLMVIRMNIYFTVLVGLLLFLLYVVDEFYEYVIQEELKIHLDTINDDDKKKEEEKKLKFLKKEHEYLKNIVLILEYLIILITIIGFIYYFIKQKIDKKNKFSYSKFILGDLTCEWEK